VAADRLDDQGDLAFVCVPRCRWRTTRPCWSRASMRRRRWSCNRTSASRLSAIIVASSSDWTAPPISTTDSSPKPAGTPAREAAGLPTTMRCEPGPGLGDRRRWRADPGACPAAGGELAQVQHDVGLGSPNAGAPRPGCTEDGPPPTRRIAGSRRFRSAPHSGVATARKHPHGSCPPCGSSAAPCPPAHAQPRHVQGLFGSSAGAGPQAAGAPAGPRARAAAPGQAARPRPVWPARDHSSSPRNHGLLFGPSWLGWDVGSLPLSGALATSRVPSSIPSSARQRRR
jgi:hypothetical protein